MMSKKGDTYIKLFSTRSVLSKINVLNFVTVKYSSR